MEQYSRNRSTEIKGRLNDVNEKLTEILGEEMQGIGEPAAVSDIKTPTVQQIGTLMWNSCGGPNETLSLKNLEICDCHPKTSGQMNGVFVYKHL